MSSAVSFGRKWYILFCGLCMGAADLVPGISGGTIAFIMGFYNPLLDSLKTINSSSLRLLLTGRFHAFSQAVAWKFLLTLFAGIVLAFVSLSSFFHFLLGHEVYRIYLYSAFLGLILASFVFCLRQLKAWKAYHLVGLIFGAVIAYLLTNASSPFPTDDLYAVKIDLNTTEVTLNNYDAAQQLLTNLSHATLGAMLAKGLISSDTSIYSLQGGLIGKAADFVPQTGYRFDIWLMFCGALAVCALLLPGISGSYVLTLLGVYPLIITSLVDLIEGAKQLSFDQDAFFILLNVGIGILVGLFSFARVVSWLLKQYPDSTIAILSGFLIGALRSVWPFWTYEYALLPLKLQKGPQLLVIDPIWPSLLSPIFLWSVLCAAGGFALVFSVEYMAISTRSQRCKKI